jgi:hypothetical protein
MAGLTGGHPLRFSVLETLGAHRTLTQAEVNAADIFTFDPGGAARNLVLPAEADNAGVVLYVNNAADAAEILTIQDDSPATVCTPTQNESAIVWCDGVSWFGHVGAAS